MPLTHDECSSKQINLLAPVCLLGGASTRDVEKCREMILIIEALRVTRARVCDKPHRNARVKYCAGSIGESQLVIVAPGAVMAAACCNEFEA
jgi:hypothetical protein